MNDYDIPMYIAASEIEGFYWQYDDDDGEDN